MTQPTLPNYLEASSFAYNTGTVAGAPSGYSGTFAVAGAHYLSSHNYDAFNPFTGFYGAAYTLGSGSNESVVISFEGTNITDYSRDSIFSTNEVLADYHLYKAELPTALKEAAQFAQAVVSTANAEGISDSNIYLTGHSLGAAEAEYADVATGLTGTTFGTPGISSAYIPSGATSHLTNYVDYGDPVGNYAYTGPNSPEGPFIYSDNIEHFGTTDYVGKPQSASALVSAGQEFGSRSLSAKAEGLKGFLAAAELYHNLKHYAGDLGYTLSDPPLGATTLNGNSLAQLYGASIHHQS